jgi:anti-sigma B factor antagonist
MNLTVTQSTDTITWLALAGSLDIAGSQLIENQFLAHTAAGNKAVIVDFSGVTYIASFGLRLIIQAYKALDRKGKKLAILRPQPEVAKVFTAAGLTDFLLITDDEAEAIAALGL